MRRRQLLTTTAALAGSPVLAASAASSASASAASAAPGVRRPAPGGEVRTGFDALRDSGYASLAGRRVGVISNPTGVDRGLGHIVDAMAEDGRIDIQAVFGPEHGFRGVSQAGEGEDFFTDPRTGLPVYNAYNDAAELERVFGELGLEAVVFDIQDVGARFYTYIWTMYLAMEAAARLGLRFVVLDRPNPLGGQDAFGPVLHEENASFVGLKAIAQHHGMTVGELAGLFNAEFVPAGTGGRRAELHVERMSGWRRGMRFDETGLPWVPPSPNMPTPHTAELYVGTCLFEASALSEGRGTTLPFQQLGAPGVDHRWHDVLSEREVPGALFREAYFVPVFSKWANETCGGVEVLVTDPEAFDPIHTALTMLTEQWRLFPDLRWREQDGEDSGFWLDKLTGDRRVRRAVERGTDPDDLPAVWQDDLAAFRRLRRGHLLYR